MVVFLFFPLIAAIPSAIYMYMILRLNKAKRNPAGVIAILITLSTLSMFGSTVLNNVLTNSVLDETGLSKESFVYQVIFYLLIVPIVEEGFKFLVLITTTWNRSSFTHSYDGVVFGVSAALGFAVIENLIYMLSFGWWAGLARAFFPIHIVCGIFMGHYYMLSKKSSNESNPSKFRYYLAVSLLLPMGLHGFFNFSLNYNGDVMIYLFLVFVIVLAVVTVRSTRKYSKNNMPIQPPVAA